MSCLGEISNLKYDVCTNFSKDLLLLSKFSLDHNRITYGVVLRYEDPVHPRKIKPGLVWGKEDPPGPSGQQHLRDMVPLPVLSHPPLGLTMLALSSL